MHTVWNSRKTNLSEWTEQIVDDFYEKHAIDERDSVDNIKKWFHDDFYETFLCTMPTLLFKFLIDKGIAHIVKPRLPLLEPRSNNGRECIIRWEKFVKN